MPGLYAKSINSGIASFHWFFSGASSFSSFIVFFSVAIAILSQIFLSKPQNNLVSVLSVCHIECLKAGISGKIAENFGRPDRFFSA